MSLTTAVFVVMAAFGGGAICMALVTKAWNWFKDLKIGL